MGNILNQGTVVVEVGGSPVHGRYTVWDGIITVVTIHGIKKAAVSVLPLEHLARIMVRKLATDAPKA
jgi:hypothetical protein